MSDLDITNPEFESIFDRNLHDWDSRRVYADWLEQNHNQRLAYAQRWMAGRKVAPEKTGTCPSYNPELDEPDVRDVWEFVRGIPWIVHCGMEKDSSCEWSNRMDAERMLAESLDRCRSGLEYPRDEK